MNREIKKVTGFRFPFAFKILNKGLSEKDFGQIIYEYGFKRGGVSALLYMNNKEIVNNQLKVVNVKDSLNYLVYTRHFTDSTIFTQNQLKPYVNKMLKLGQDTLHIGTVSEFKKNHPELFKMLTENDTILIRYLKNKNSGLGERIAIPANW